MNGGTPHAKSTRPRGGHAGEPVVLVQFLDGPQGEQALEALVRALARQAARQLLSVAPGAAAPPTPSDRGNG